MSALNRLTKTQKAELEAALRSMKEGHHKTTAVKLEMEAQFNRGDYRNNGDCGACAGTGYIYCDYCDEGEGGHEHTPDCSDDCGEEYDTCDECHGDYRQECDHCAGTGRIEPADGDTPNWADTLVCQEWLLNHVPASAREAVKYIRFYVDGTVDSECTLTVPIEKAHVLVHFIEAWNALGEAIGNGVNIRRAGMHIGILNDPEYRYNTGDSVNRLNPIYTQHFADSMTPLLPALYFLASPNNQSRELSYRRPYISAEKHGFGRPYGAICTHNNTMFEYRIFETCYDNPLMLVDFLIVIAKTLQFYGPNYIDTSLKLGNLGWKDGRGLERFYYTVKHLTALEKGLKWLKPNYKTIEQLKAERNFKLDRKVLRQQHQQRTAAWTSQYSGIKTRRHYERLAKYHAYLQQGYSLAAQNELYNATPQQFAKQQLRDWLQRQGVRMKGGLRQYVKQMAMEYECNAEYTITV